MLTALKYIRTALTNISPEEIRERTERPLAVGLVASSPSGFADMEDFLAPPNLTPGKRIELLKILHRNGDPGLPERFDLVLYEQGVPCPMNSYTFYRENPEMTVAEILRERDDLALALARHFVPFRKPVLDRVISAVARENALFAIATALPNVLPSLIELPWAVGEFASDTAFLTINQVRMAFLIAAASDKQVGYAAQKAEIGAIVAGAFGWRTLARELAGKIPVGGGLIPKGTIAFAGTYVVGRGLEKFYQIGYGYSRSERRVAYENALGRGRAVAEAMVAAYKRRA
jgi:hypothetical protein